jgi:transcriptional repressor NrdR
VEKGAITIAKRDGRREPFKREKLVSGIRIACAKRQVNSEKIEEMANLVESKLAQLGPAEVSYDVIGDLVMKELYKVDSVAYVRFASVYKEFREVGEFVKLVMENKS